MMTRQVATVVLAAIAACGGSDGGGEGGGDLDVMARCSLIGEDYDAFSAASGARCGSTEGAGYCFAGDLCRSDGVCELVSTPTQDGWCAVLRTTYDAFTSADGARCGTGDGSGYCMAGDHCRSAGICEAVLSAADGQPHAGIFGARYTGFSSADGPRCGSGDGAPYCFGGDRCVEPGVCVFVLKGLGGTVRSELLGTQYTAATSGDGARCGTSEGSGYCKAGDRCVDPTTGTCEVLLSAWTP